MTFYAPGIKNPGPHSECFACSYSKREHGPKGECPEDHRRTCTDDDCKCYGDQGGQPISRNEDRRISADGP